MCMILIYGCAAQKPGRRPPAAVHDTEIGSRVARFVSAVDRAYAGSADDNAVQAMFMQEEVQMWEWGSAASPYLIQAFHNPRHGVKTRMYLARIMGGLNDEGVIAPLIEMIENPSEEWLLREESLRVLVGMSSARIKEELKLSIRIVDDEAMQLRIREALKAVR